MNKSLTSTEIQSVSYIEAVYMAGRLFISRLDEARSPDVLGKPHDIVGRPRARTEEVYDMADILGTVNRSCDAKADHPVQHTNGSEKESKYGESSTILEKLAEYLFDLFDANALEDYAKMEKFEIRALESFQDFAQTEYTHQQHALHDEFVTLFEQLIEGFLASEGYAIDVFYEELVYFNQKSKAMASSKPLATPLSPADEVLEVVSNYMRFDVWADLMRHQARQQAEFRTMREHVQAAYTAGLSERIDESAGSKEGVVKPGPVHK